MSKEQDAPAILKPFEDSVEAEFGGPSGVHDDFELRCDHGSVYTGRIVKSFAMSGRSITRFLPSVAQPATLLQSA